MNLQFIRTQMRQEGGQMAHSLSFRLTPPPLAVGGLRLRRRIAMAATQNSPVQTIGPAPPPASHRVAVHSSPREVSRQRGGGTCGPSCHWTCFIFFYLMTKISAKWSISKWSFHHSGCFQTAGGVLSHLQP